MAILEFEFKGIDQNFRSSASNVLKDIEKIKSAFRDVGQGVSGDALKAVLGSQKVALAEAKVEAVKLAQTHKNELATSLNDAKARFIDAKTAIQAYNLEQKKLAAEQRAGRNNQGAYSDVSKELNQMRNEAKNLGAQLILLDKAGMSSSVTFNTIKNRFDATQKEVLELDQAIKKLDTSLGQNNRRVGAYGNALSGYQQAQSGANGVAMEFNRIIQDAPYGMMGIGNNIQQLAANWGYYTEQARAAAIANKTSVTSMSLAKGALSAMISPANLLTLGIAAVTSAWTYYQMNAQKANKSTKEAKDGVDNYRDSLIGLNKELANSNAEGQKELSKLNLLKNAYDDVSQSQKTRKDAYNEIISIYESYYGKLSNEEKKTFDLAEAYNKLASSILKTATARGYERQIDKNIDSIINLNLQIEQSGKKYKQATKEYLEYKKNTASSKFGGTGFVGDMARTRDSEAELKYNKALKENDDLIERRTSLLSLNEKYQSDILRLGKDGAKIAENSNETESKITDNRERGNSAIGQTFDYLQKISELLGSKQQDLDMFGLTGQAKELQELSNSYSDFYRELDKLRKKAAKDKNAPAGIQGTIDSSEKTGEGLENAETIAILQKWQDERNRITEESNNKWGFINQTSREDDLLKLSIYVKDYEKKLRQAGATTEEIAHKIASLNMVARFKIDVEYYSKQLDEINEGNDKLADSINKPFSSKTRKGMQSELKRREYELRQSIERQNDLSEKITGRRATQEQVEEVVTLAKAKWQVEIDDQSRTIFREFLVNTASQAYQQIFSSLRSNVEEFGFGLNAIFFTISDTLKSTIDSINTQNIQDVFKGIQESGMSFFDSAEGANKGLAAAASTLGNLISSSTSKSSILGQGLGGALSGGAAMASTGNPYLIAAGAAIGLLGGIFGAKKAQKQEELQRRQLEEQRKANALLERMNALAYTSSIIGGQSQYGVVSGVNRNFAGEFVFRIDGRDLLATIDNNNRFNGR